MILTSSRGKQVLITENQDEVTVRFTDEATAFHNVKRAIVPGKGATINSIAVHIFELLERNRIKTHFIKKLNETEQLCHRVEVIPIHVVVRNVVSGSLAKKLGMEEGVIPKFPIYETYYKNSELGYPLINEDHAVALGLATAEELLTIRKLAFEINDVIRPYFESLNIMLVDYKIEFGRLNNKEIILSEEISPDISRMRDLVTGEHLDKDRFSKGLGSIKEAYDTILQRMNEKENK